jgi:hypothetical protein
MCNIGAHSWTVSIENEKLKTGKMFELEERFGRIEGKRSPVKSSLAHAL